MGPRNKWGPAPVQITLGLLDSWTHPVVTCVVPGCIIGIETPDGYSNLNNWVLWGQNYPRSSGKIQVGAPQTALVVTVNQKRMACGRDAEHNAMDETHGDARHTPSCSRVPALRKRSWIVSRLSPAVSPAETSLPEARVAGNEC